MKAVSLFLVSLSFLAFLHKSSADQRIIRGGAGLDPLIDYLDTMDKSYGERDLPSFVKAQYNCKYVPASEGSPAVNSSGPIQIDFSNRLNGLNFHELWSQNFKNLSGNLQIWLPGVSCINGGDADATFPLASQNSSQYVNSIQTFNMYSVCNDNLISIDMKLWARVDDSNTKLHLEFKKLSNSQLQISMDREGKQGGQDVTKKFSAICDATTDKTARDNLDSTMPRLDAQGNPVVE